MVLEQHLFMRWNRYLKIMEKIEVIRMVESDGFLGCSEDLEEDKMLKEIIGN